MHCRYMPIYVFFADYFYFEVACIGCLNTQKSMNMTGSGISVFISFMTTKPTQCASNRSSIAGATGRLWQTDNWPDRHDSVCYWRSKVIIWKNEVNRRRNNSTAVCVCHLHLTNRNLQEMSWAVSLRKQKNRTLTNFVTESCRHTFIVVYSIVRKIDVHSKFENLENWH